MSFRSKHLLAGLRGLLILFIALGGLAIANLANTPQAHAEEDGQPVYATMYQKNGEYTLVFQEKSAVESTRGTKVASTAVTLSEGFHVQDLFSYGDEQRAFSVYPQHIAFSGSIKPQNLSSFFKNDYNDGPLAQVKTIDLHGLNTSKVCSMSSMFQGCSGLVALDLSPLDASYVDTMNSMFEGCNRLKTLDLSTLNAGPMETSRMFLGCSELESINLSGVNTASVFGMRSMFHGCSALKSMDMSDHAVCQVSDMSFMFSGCSELKSVKLPRQYDQVESNLKLMTQMFYRCEKLETIDFTPLDISTVEKYEGYNSMSGILSECSSLTSIALRPNSRIVNQGFYPCYAQECKSENPAIASISENGDCLSTNALGSTRLVFTSSEWNYVTDSFEPPRYTYLSIVVKNPDEKLVNQEVTPSEKNSIAKATVKVKARAFSGKKLAPKTITVKLDGKTLKNGTDYSVSYKCGKTVGSYKVTIKGTGSYTGTKKATFKIVPKAVSGAKVKGSKKSLKVTWKKPSKKVRTQVTGYQVRYSTSKSMKNAKSVKTKGSSKTSVNIKRLKSGKRYYVQVRAYKTVKGKTYYSAWSAMKSAKAKK